jgi:hypothetical protein
MSSQRRVISHLGLWRPPWLRYSFAAFARSSARPPAGDRPVTRAGVMSTASSC